MPDQNMTPCREAFDEMWNKTKADPIFFDDQPNDNGELSLKPVADLWFSRGWQAAKADQAEQPDEKPIFPFVRNPAMMLRKEPKGQYQREAVQPGGLSVDLALLRTAIYADIEAECGPSGADARAIENAADSVMGTINPFLRSPEREAVTQLIAECRDAMRAGLPYMEGSTFSNQYARDQVRRQIAACEEALTQAEEQGRRG